MKCCRFQEGGAVHYGLIEGDAIRELSGSYFAAHRPTGRTVRFDDVRLLAPATPSKAVMVGLNYRDHAEETGATLPAEPCLFIKPDTSVIGPEDKIRYPAMVGRLDYEAELGIVIGKTLHDADAAAARAAIFGYTCVNDVTARDLQKKDGQWTRSKSFDTFCPIGPWIVTDIEANNLAIELYLNGQRKQFSNTNQLVFKPDALVSFISRVMTLKPGDVIGTGTPSGIGPMQKGDEVEVRIERIGSLRNVVA